MSPYLRPWKSKYYILLRKSDTKLYNNPKIKWKFSMKTMLILVFPLATMFGRLSLKHVRTGEQMWLKYGTVADFSLEKTNSTFYDGKCTVPEE